MGESRRSFLKKSAAGLALFTILPRNVFGAMGGDKEAEAKKAKEAEAKKAEAEAAELQKKADEAKHKADAARAAAK